MNNIIIHNKMNNIIIYNNTIIYNKINNLIINNINLNLKMKKM